MKLRDCIPTARQMTLGAGIAVLIICAYGPINYFVFH